MTSNTNQLYYLLKALNNWQPVEIPPISIPEKTGTIDNLSGIFSHLHEIDTVSFDLFDTLLQRDVDPPEYVKQFTAEWLKNQMQQQSVTISRDLLLHMREIAEAKARQNSMSEGFDVECTLSSVLNLWVSDLKNNSSIK